MKRREDHETLHGGAGGGGSGRAPRTAQWQAPQRSNGYDRYYHHKQTDLDLEECAFFEAFTGASDPISFLKVARIPFEAADREGRRLVLLRVECTAGIDVGSVSPRPVSEPMRYTVLPRRMATRRQCLRLIYLDDTGPRALTLSETRELAAV